MTALVLANTAVAKPDGVRVPPLIALARRATDLVCRSTPVFVDGAARMTDRSHRAALRAPYRTIERRSGIARFVEDIPLSPSDPSFAALADSASALARFSGPVLLLWGGRDPVFNDRFLGDLRRRVPRAAVQRFARASHYVPLDEAVGTVVGDWLTHRESGPSADLGVDESAVESVLTTLSQHRGDGSPLYVGPDGVLTWADLDARSTTASRAFLAAGLLEGDRVSVLVPPSPELLVGALAIWKAGGVPVVADASGGLSQLRRLVRATAPRFVMGTPRTLRAATVLGVAPGARRAGFHAGRGVVDLRADSQAGAESAQVRRGSDVAAIVHTSGSTGPAKAVRYSHRALSEIRPALEALGLEPGTVFTTSFGPFMLLAPVLGMTCVRPDFAVDRPSELGFDEFRDALALAPVTAAWLSPAAARRIVATARGRRVELTMVMLAGAPISPQLADAVAAVTGADVRAPYGMTECLPVTDGTDVDAYGSRGGYSTGRAVPGCRVRVVELGDPASEVADGEWGELLVSAAWMFDGYDGDWEGSRRSEVRIDGARFHRTGDVGYLEEGRLFHLGRRAHVLFTATGPLASVAVEGPIAAAIRRDVAAVGVGPVDAEVVCVVVQGDGRLSLADAELAASVRAATPHRVAAVLQGGLPLDHRHQSKVDRATLRRDASSLLAGR